jgi:hypothetical protein
MNRFAPWELDPGPCPSCGGGRWVLWWVAPHRQVASAERQLVGSTARGLWCRACTPGLSSALAVAVNLEGELYVWQHPRCTLDHQAVSTLGWWLTSLTQLVRHRAIERARPGAWRLEVGDDGRLWMPWNRASDGKTGEPWPLRQSVLRKANASRECMCCARSLDAGEEVYRADMRYLAVRRTSEGWTRESLTKALVCSACGQAVMLAVMPELPGLRVVKHLVAIDGGIAE